MVGTGQGEAWVIAVGSRVSVWSGPWARLSLGQDATGWWGRRWGAC